MSNLPAIEGGTPVRPAFLPFARPWIGEEAEREVVEAMRSGWITTGPRTHAFEEKLRTRLGTTCAVATNSCTGALHSALAACRFEPGDEIITSPITFPSTSNVVIHLGLIPRFVDIEPDTLNLDATKLEAAITPRTRAVIPVHLAGQPCDMDPILDIAHRHNLFVLEDAAHAINARYRNRMIGTIGDATAFSFYAIKNITTGEGGMLTTDNEELAARVRTLILHGMTADAWDRYGPRGFKHWVIEECGFKYNMSDMMAAIGLHQLDRMDQFQTRRRILTEKYHEAIADIPAITSLAPRSDRESSCHLLIIRIEPDRLKVNRNRILDAIQAENIGVGLHFTAVHLHPYYRRRFPDYPGTLPHAELASESILSLPLYPRMSDDDWNDTATALDKVIRHYLR